VAAPERQERRSCHALDADAVVDAVTRSGLKMHKERSTKKTKPKETPKGKTLQEIRETKR
jgi:hypothetical protein